MRPSLYVVLRDSWDSLFVIVPFTPTYSWRSCVVFPTQRKRDGGSRWPKLDSRRSQYFDVLLSSVMFKTSFRERQVSWSLSQGTVDVLHLPSGTDKKRRVKVIIGSYSRRDEYLDVTTTLPPSRSSLPGFLESPFWTETGLLVFCLQGNQGHRFLTHTLREKVPMYKDLYRS